MIWTIVTSHSLHHFSFTLSSLYIILLYFISFCSISVYAPFLYFPFLFTCDLCYGNPPFYDRIPYEQLSSTFQHGHQQLSFLFHLESHFILKIRISFCHLAEEEKEHVHQCSKCPLCANPDYTCSQIFIYFIEM